MQAVGLWIIVCGNSPSGAANAFKLMLWDEQGGVGSVREGTGLSCDPAWGLSGTGKKRDWI